MTISLYHGDDTTAITMRLPCNYAIVTAPVWLKKKSSFI